MSSTVIESVTRIAPLGLELIDAASGRRVGDGLIVRVAPVGKPQRGVIADANPSGIFVAHDLPGLGDWSHGGAEPLPHPEFTVHVDDRLGRFLPCRLRLALPAAGLAHPACRADIPLFSAPTRIVAGLAAIRAELHTHPDGKPAAWAVVEVRHAGAPLCLGMTDERGHLLLAFAWPKLVLADQPLDASTWPLTLHVRHAIGLETNDTNEPPELCAALAQPAARFVNVVEPLATVPELAVTLRLGREAQVRCLITP
ncbi:MAG: hypothetical protein KBA32_16040 [Propionivibrio sp.]|jgi:hypothetical protein|uniref:hypothetical protein n=1 Tax=Propionivibrio sp. TaxID=2212460 RepID=UPI001B701A1C|nr:hypothetical protein [Propionivibrio sp.]MBP7204695.1 hypothetical protein [Propionivibrio sp.]